MSLRGLSLLVVAVAAMTLPAVATAQRSVPAGPETVVDLRVHGNHSIPDDEVLALAGVALGDVVTPELVETVTDRLQASGYFETVEVRKRYRTLTATDRVALVIVVRERPATSIRNAALRSVVGLLRQTLFLPMVRYDEGYGLTYGARFALVDIAGAGSRVLRTRYLGSRSASCVRTGGATPRAHRRSPARRRVPWPAAASGARTDGRPHRRARRRRP